MTSLPDGDLGLFSPLVEYLQEITDALAAISTMRAVTESVLTPTVKALGAVAGIVLLVDQTDQQMKIAGSQGYEDGALTLWQEGPIEDHVLISDILRMREARYFEHMGALKEAYPDLESRTGALAATANAVLPMFLDGQPLGVIVLDFKEPHHFNASERRFLKILSAQCAVALGRAEVSRTLEVRVEERTRQLEDERAALDVFASFTEAVGTQTDVRVLARQAVRTMRANLDDVSAVYYEPEGELWRAQVWSDDLAPQLLAQLQAGVPRDAPEFARAVRERAGVFSNSWDAGANLVDQATEYSATAFVALLLGEEARGLFAVGIREARSWTEREKRIVQAVARGLTLALERTDQTRQLEEERAALAAFVAYSEAAGIQTDVSALSQQAVRLLSLRFTNCSTGYYQLEDGLWKLRVHTDDLYANPEGLAAFRAGLPRETPIFMQALQTRAAAFVDAWDPQRGQIERTEAYGTLATYPLSQEGQVQAMLAIGLRDQQHWLERDREVFRAVGRGLQLAMERSEVARSLQEQNAELDARTRALEGFAELSRELVFETNQYTLVRRAQEIVLRLLPRGYAVYYESEGPLWRLKSQVGSLGDDALQAVVEAGLPHHAPSVLTPFLTRQPLYQDVYAQGMDTPAEVVQHIQAVATLPLLVHGLPVGVFGVGLFEAWAWTPIDKVVLETVVHHLGLALERAEAVGELSRRTHELERSNAELQAANEELDAFAYSASHDLRTPVRHVKSFAELARRALQSAPNPLAERHMQVIEDAAERMNTMIDAMLELSRSSRQELRLGPVNLQTLVERAQADMAQELEGRTVEWRVNGLPPVTGDQGSLQQVMTNLISNAVKYSRGRELAVIEVWAEERPGEWVVSVRDNGAGFNPIYAQRLFGAFQRLHSQAEFEGTGIGLATVRRIIVRHGGTVSAQGQRDEGATFSFTLPKVD